MNARDDGTPVKKKKHRGPSIAEGWVPQPEDHGRPFCYSRGCRCETCVQKNYARQKAGEYTKKYRDRQLDMRELVNGRWVHPSPPSGHGTLGAYTGSGCRCEDCLTAMKSYQKVRGDRVRQRRDELAAKDAAVAAENGYVVDPTSVFSWDPGVRPHRATRSDAE